MSFRPSLGFSHAREELVTGSQFAVLGPLSEGDVVRRMIVHVQVFGVTTWRFGASLGTSRQGTQAGLRAGRSLLTISDLPAINGDQGVPHIGFRSTVQGFHEFTFFPGLMVTGASGFIQVHSITTAGPGFFLLVTFEISNFVTDKVQVIESS